MVSRSRNGRGGVRPGSGRPRLLDSPVRITIKLEQETLDRLARWADEERMPVSAYMRRVLDEHSSRRRPGSIDPAVGGTPSPRRRR